MVLLVQNYCQLIKMKADRLQVEDQAGQLRLPEHNISYHFQTNGDVSTFSASMIPGVCQSQQL